MVKKSSWVKPRVKLHCDLFQLLERPNDWGLDVFQLAEVVSPSRALGVLGFTLFKVGEGEKQPSLCALVCWELAC